MNYNNDNEMWEWPGEDYNLEDNTNVDVSKCILNGVNETEGFSYMLDVGTTPVKDCGDLAYNNSSCENKSMEEGLYREPSSQVKRRRMLQFESEVLDAPFCNEDMPSTFLGSQETVESVEEAISEMSQWVSGFAESTSASGNEALDLSSEEWLADCFNDAEMHLSFEETNISGASDVQVTELGNNPPQSRANVVQEQPVRTPRNVVFKGRKSYMRAPSKSASSVVYPFDFIKPCGIRGDVTLKDINQRIRTPPSKTEENHEDPSVSYPKSAFSGKPVVGKTKIRTEGGKGCITIMRTKG